MKKLFTIVIISSLITFLSAQSYQEFIQKAKKAEQENKWISALGYYYDAAHSSEAQPDTENRYIEIKKAIENGKPGLNGEDDIFETDNKWDALETDFITYFTENCPWSIYLCNEFERVKLNKENKTADYKIYYLTGVNKKYRLIREIFQKGTPHKTELYPNINEQIKSKKDVWSKEWYDDMSKKVEQFYKTTALAYYYAIPYKYGSKEQKYLYAITKKIDLSKEPESFEELINTGLNAFVAYSWTSNELYPMSTTGICANVKLYENTECIYELKDVFIDCKKIAPFYDEYDFTNNFEYYNNTPYLENTKDYCKSILLKNIPQSIVNKIEAGKIKITLDNAYIPYGFQAIPNESGRIPMNLGYMGTATPAQNVCSGWDDGYQAHNKDIRFRINEVYDLKSYAEELPESYFSRNEAVVYQTNIFDEIISIRACVSIRTSTHSYNIDNNIDKKTAKRITKEMKNKGWNPLKNGSEDYFTKSCYANANGVLPSSVRYWTEESLDNKKNKDNRCLILKKEIKN